MKGDKEINLEDGLFSVVNIISFLSDYFFYLKF